MNQFSIQPELRASQEPNSRALDAFLVRAILLYQTLCLLVEESRQGAPPCLQIYSNQLFISCFCQCNALALFGLHSLQHFSKAGCQMLVVKNIFDIFKKNLNVFQHFSATGCQLLVVRNVFQKLNISQHFSAAGCKRLVVRNIFQCFFSQYFSTFSAACCQGIVVRRGDGWRCEAVGWRRRGGGGGDKKIFYFGLFTYHGN